MNTVHYPRTEKEKLAAKRKKRAMARTSALLAKLGFRQHVSRINGWIMPEYPGPILVVDEPLETIDAVLTAVFAWGHRTGAGEARNKIREALDIVP